jgi:predicted transcriptional regulator
VKAEFATTWTLTSRQLDLAWERLGLDVFPFPFEVAREGATDLERARLGSVVMDELRTAGLLDRTLRLDTDLESALRQLAGPTVSMDSAWLADAECDVRRALATLTGRRALLAEQDHGGTLTLRDIDPAGLAASLVATLPQRAAGRWPGGVWPLDAARRDRELTDRLTGEHLASGQLGSTHRDDAGRRRRGPVIRWFDLAGDGRYVLIRHPDDRVVVRPADQQRLTRLLTGA